MKRTHEKAITSFYRSIIKDTVSEAMNDIRGKKLQDIKNYGITVISKIANIDKNYLQINFYPVIFDEVNLRGAAREFGYELISDLEVLSSAEAFFNTRTNYIACRVELDEDLIPVESDDTITSTILHELTHYLDHRVASDYHDKNKVKPLDSDSLTGLPVVDEFNYLIYAIWTPTERNAFQTSPDAQWNKLKSHVDNVTSTLTDMLDVDESAILFDRLRELFIKQTDKPCPKSSSAFVSWWCKKTKMLFDEMNSKRSKDSYLSKSTDDQIESLAGLLLENFKKLLGKSSAKFEVPFQFYSTKKRSTIDERVKISIVGFMDEIENGLVSLQKSGVHLTYRDFNAIGKIYDAMYNSDIKMLKTQCLVLASQLVKLVSSKS